VGAFLMTKTNLEKSNDLFQLLQGGNIVIWFVVQAGVNGIGGGGFVVQGRTEQARVVVTHAKNLAKAGEVPEHTVATLGFEEEALSHNQLALGFVESEGQGIAVWESP
jgi:hypothetical protein